MGSNENQKDLIGYFSDFGKQFKKIFPKKRKKRKTTESEAVKAENLSAGTTFSGLSEPADGNAHRFSFGAVYANDPARAEFEKENPNFPTGAIVVREKNAFPTSETPDIVIAMVKREKGFSAETNDWEFFVFNGADLSMQKRETKGECAACHSRADKSDWIFRSYLQ